jgi:hypothetical protein
VVPNSHGEGLAADLADLADLADRMSCTATAGVLLYRDRSQSIGDSHKVRATVRPHFSWR